MHDLDEFTQAYIECALWSSTDDNDKAFGAGDGPNEREDMSHGLTWEDLDDNRGYLERAGDASQNGHDFWLTRNGHGAGFWDRGYDPDVDKHLTQAAHAFGEVYLYLHENKVYS